MHFPIGTLECMNSPQGLNNQKACHLYNVPHLSLHVPQRTLLLLFNHVPLVSDIGDQLPFYL
jgi:hypothetical protein